MQQTTNKTSETKILQIQEHISKLRHNSDTNKLPEIFDVKNKDLHAATSSLWEQEGAVPMN